MATSRSRRRRPWVIGGTIATLALVWVLFQTVGRGPSDPSIVYELALNALEQSRFDEAERQLEALAKLRPPTVLDWGVRGRLEIARNRIDRAVESLNHIPDEHALGPWARMRVGQLEARRKRLRHADEALAKAIELDPKLIEARRARIYVLGLQLRRPELHKEFSALSRLATLTAREIWVWCMVRELAWWSPTEHVPILQDALRNDPDDRWSRLALAENHLRLVQPDLASEVLAPLPESDPDANVLKARMAIERQDLDTAEALLSRNSAENASLDLARGRLALARGDGRAALKFLTLANAAEPGRRAALSDLARACTLAGLATPAREYASASGKIDALNSLLLNSEANITRRDPEHWRTLARACETAQRLPEARAWYALIAADNPLDQDAQNAIYRLDPQIRPSTTDPGQSPSRSAGM